MKSCSKCKGETTEIQDRMPDGVPYTYYRCLRCGFEALDMQQLHEVAERYRALKRHRAKAGKWGASIGIRIPMELARAHKITIGDEFGFLSEKDGIRIVKV